MNVFKLIKAESYTRGMALSVLFNIISKGILFLLTIVIARYFGSNIKTDIYFFVFTTMILFSSFINNTDTAVLVPESMRLRVHEGDARANSFLNFFLVVYLAIGLVFTVLMYFFGTAVFGLLSKFSEADILRYRHYFLLGSCFFVFHILTSYLNSILTSLRFFSLPLIISSIKSCIVIAMIFLLKENFDVLSVILGGLISYAVNLLIQLVVLYKLTGWKFDCSIPTIKKLVWGNMLYAQLGQAVNVISSLFPLYLLSGFGSGVISVMNYGKNIADIPNTMITAQFTSVIGVQLNELAAKKDDAGMNEVFLNTSRLIVFLLVPLGCFMFVFATPIVQLLYGNGNFTQAAVADTAKFMQLLSVTVFSIGVNAVVTRVFIAKQVIKGGLIYQVILSSILIMLIFLFVNIFGPLGYGYAVVVLNILNIVGLYFTCGIIVPELNYMALFRFTGTIILINSLIALIIYLFSTWLKLSLIFELLVFFSCWLFILLIIFRIWYFDLVSKTMNKNQRVAN